MSNGSESPETINVDGTTIRVGMPLIDNEGNYIGKVKEIQEKGFLVDRSPMHFQDLFIPYWVNMDSGPEQIKLKIGRGEINQNVWRASDRE